MGRIVLNPLTLFLSGKVILWSILAEWYLTLKQLHKHIRSLWFAKEKIISAKSTKSKKPKKVEMSNYLQRVQQ